MPSGCHPRRATGPAYQRRKNSGSKSSREMIRTRGRDTLNAFTSCSRSCSETPAPVSWALTNSRNPISPTRRSAPSSAGPPAGSRRRGCRAGRRRPSDSASRVRWMPMSTTFSPARPASGIGGSRGPATPDEADRQVPGGGVEEEQAGHGLAPEPLRELPHPLPPRPLVGVAGAARARVAEGRVDVLAVDEHEGAPRRGRHPSRHSRAGRNDGASASGDGGQDDHLVAVAERAPPARPGTARPRR